MVKESNEGGVVMENIPLQPWMRKWLLKASPCRRTWKSEMEGASLSRQARPEDYAYFNAFRLARLNKKMLSNGREATGGSRG